MLKIILFFSILNLVYWVLVFTKLFRYTFNYHNESTRNKKINKTAIIISVRNEEQNLKNNLPSFINQVPKGYKIVIVDDYSEDNTLNILDNFSKQYPNLIVIKNKSNQGKKYALSYAIHNIKEDYLLFTDADCFVKSEKWLQKMILPFDDKIKIVLGYSPYAGKSFLSRFIRFETFMAAIQYLNYALLGIPYMGVGRNMAIEKKLFIDTNGYNSHLDIKSGNDDLFVNANANKYNTAIQIDPDTFVYTLPPETLTGFIKQKVRHISTSFRYKTIHKFLLGIYSTSHIMMYLFLIIGMFLMPFKIVFLIWLLRIIIILLFSYRSFKLLKEKDLFWLLPVMDFLMFVYYLFMGIYYIFADRNKW